jgi:four helix bundle protein
MGQSYRDLVAWQKAMVLARLVYDFTDAFPKTETFGLTIQMRRAAISIPSNIAEARLAIPNGSSFTSFATPADHSPSLKPRLSWRRIWVT